MSREQTRLLRLGLALSTTLLFWASAFVAIRSAAQHLAAPHLALLRFLTGSLALLIYFGPQLRRPSAREFPVLLICGAIGIASYHLLLNYGARYVTAGSAALLISVMPIFTAILARIFLRERLAVITWLGVAISFAGIFLISQGHKAGLDFNVRALCIVLAASCTSTYVVLQKKYLGHFGAIQFICWTFFTGTAVLAATCWPGFVPAVVQAPLRVKLEVIYLGVFPGAIAYITFAYAVRHLRASSVTSFTYFTPVLTMLIEWPYLHEVPTALSLLGGALTVAGVIIVNRLGRAPTAAESDAREALVTVAEG